MYGCGYWGGVVACYTAPPPSSSSHGPMEVTPVRVPTPPQGTPEPPDEHVPLGCCLTYVGISASANAAAVIGAGCSVAGDSVGPDSGFAVICSESGGSFVGPPGVAGGIDTGYIFGNRGHVAGGGAMLGFCVVAGLGGCLSLSSGEGYLGVNLFIGFGVKTGGYAVFQHTSVWDFDPTFWD